MTLDQGQDCSMMAPPDTSVSTAAKLMAESEVSALVAVEDRRLVGIFTERDAVFRVIAQHRNAQTTPLFDVMTRTPKPVTPSESFAQPRTNVRRRPADR